MLFTGFKSKRRQKLVKGLIIFVAVTFAGGLVYTGVRFTLDRSPSVAEAVASVNGERILRSSFEQSFQNVLRQQESLMGSIPPDYYAQIKLYTLDQLVTNRLLVQQAKKDKVKVSAKDLNERLAKEKANFPSEAAFKEALAASGLTLSKFKAMLREQIMVENLLSGVRDKVTVSDEDIAKAYTEETKKEAKGKEFEEAKAGIKERLLYEAQSKAMGDWFKKLHDAAKIDIMDLGLKAAKEAADGKFDSAISLYEQALAQGPVSFDLYIGLGKAYDAKGDKDKALLNYERARDLSPNDPYMRLLLGDAYRERKQTEKALQEYELASNLAYSDIMLHYRLQSIYTDMGRKDLAAVEEQKITDIQKMYEAMRKAQESQNKTGQTAPQAQPDKESGAGASKGNAEGAATGKTK